jgi:hypothetical protein
VATVGSMFKISMANATKHNIPNRSAYRNVFLWSGIYPTLPAMHILLRSLVIPQFPICLLRKLLSEKENSEYNTATTRATDCMNPITVEVHRTQDLFRMNPLR